MKRLLNRFLGRNDGAIAVEFALVGPLLFLVIFGLIEGSRLYFVRSNLQYAADEVGRYVMINKTAADDTITQQVRNRITSVEPNDVSVTVTSQTINSKPFKQISLAYTFEPLGIDTLSWSNIDLQVESTIPVLP